jgi:hypothetical protein
MPKKVLDDVKRHALVHEETGERVAQVMQAHIGETGATPDAVPTSGMPQVETRIAPGGFGPPLPYFEQGQQLWSHNRYHRKSETIEVGNGNKLDYRTHCEHRREQRHRAN